MWKYIAKKLLPYTSVEDVRYLKEEVFSLRDEITSVSEYLGFTIIKDIEGNISVEPTTEAKENILLNINLIRRDQMEKRLAEDVKTVLTAIEALNCQNKRINQFKRVTR